MAWFELLVFGLQVLSIHDGGGDSANAPWNETILSSFIRTASSSEGER